MNLAKSVSSSPCFPEVSLRFNRLPVLLQRFFPMVQSSPGVPLTLVEAVENWKNHCDRCGVSSSPWLDYRGLYYPVIWANYITTSAE